MRTAPQPIAHAWATIVGNATTAQRHACVIAARGIVGEDDPERLVTAYRQLRAEDAYAALDELHLSASQIAELAIVVNGGPAGVNGHRLDGGVRKFLAARSLTAVQPGSRWRADDWRATVSATLAGVALVRAAQGRPVELTGAEVVPLAIIERAMRATADGGAPSWPGSDLSLRVAQMWRLVEYVRVPPPPGVHWSGQLGTAVYRLTVAGLDALERHRRSDDKPVAEATARTAAVLDRINHTTYGDLGKLDAATTTALQKCLSSGWVVEGELIPGSVRRVLRVTEAGRDALAGWTFRKQSAETAPPAPTRTAAEVEPGQWVRLSNRKDRPGVGPEWVRVADVRHAQTSTRERLANNYEVWVTRDATGEPYLYGGRAVFRTVRFQVKAL